MTEPRWHGWGFDGTILSVAPSPENGRAVALILSRDGDHRVLAEFFSEWDAAEAMAFLDGAFSLTSDANALLLKRVAELGG